MIRRCATVLMILFLGFLSACASDQTATQKLNTPNDSARARMKRGVEDMRHEDYGAAVEEFDKLLVNKPASEFDLMALYDDGAAHMAMDECKKATLLFRQAVQGSAAIKAPQMEAEALYQLSLAYECTGEDRKAIVAMLDVHKHMHELPAQIAQAELPARLASAYARIGQRDKALQYFHEASSGLKTAIADAGTTSRIQKQFAARTLYSMGQLTNRQKGLNSDSTSYLKSLSMQQPYLLQSAELAVEPDSRKAAEDLIFAYDNLMKLKPSEPKELRPFLELALQDIAEIKKIRLPNKGALVDEIYDKIEVQESRVRQMLMALSDTTPLTKESQMREGIRRDGRTVGPATELEKQGQQNQQ